MASKLMVPNIRKAEKVRGPLSNSVAKVESKLLVIASQFLSDMVQYWDRDSLLSLNIMTRPQKSKAMLEIGLVF